MAYPSKYKGNYKTTGPGRVFNQKCRSCGEPTFKVINGYCNKCYRGDRIGPQLNQYPAKNLKGMPLTSTTKKGD